MNGRIWFVNMGVIFSLFLSGCFGFGEKDVTDERIYVNVNGTKLTESEFKSLVPGDVYSKLTKEHKKEIVEEWVNNELLFQEALRRGIDKKPEISRILENSKRNLLTNELLENIYVEIKTPDDKVLERFYEERKDYFILVNDEYRIRYALFNKESESKDFWNQVKGGESFTKLAKNMSKDPEFRMGSVFGIVNEEMVEPTIWQEIIRTVDELGLVKISNPFAVVDGWMCIIVDEKYEQGSVLPFRTIRDQVLDMYIVEKHQEKRDAFLKRLTGKADISYGTLN